MLILLTLGLVIWTFFDPALGTLVLTGFIILFEGYLGYMARRRKHLSINQLSQRQLALAQEYYFFLRVPMTAQKLSSTASGIQLASIPVAIWLAYNGYHHHMIGDMGNAYAFYFFTALFIVNYFVAARLSMKLSPLTVLQKAAARGDHLAIQNLSDLREMIN